MSKPKNPSGLRAKLFLDLSTVHLTDEDTTCLSRDARFWEDNSGEPVLLGVVEFKEGFCVPLSPKDISQAMREIGGHYSDTFLQIFMAAVLMKCHLIVFHQDADVFDGFPTF